MLLMPTSLKTKFNYMFYLQLKDHLNNFVRHKCFLKKPNHLENKDVYNFTTVSSI